MPSLPCSALIGASRVSQIEDCVAALDKPDFTEAELAEINVYAKEAAGECLGSKVVTEDQQYSDCAESVKSTDGESA